MSGLNLKKKTELCKDPYIINRESIIDLLDDIQKFEINMKKFNEEYNNPFSYDISIEHTDGNYTAKLKMIDNRC